MDKNKIICIDFNKFENFKEFSEFIEKNEEFKDIYTEINSLYKISYGSVFKKLSKIWVLDNFVIYIQHKGSNKMIINPDFENIVLKKSINLVNEIKISEENSNIKLDIDSILDKINDVGIENLTLEEKEFLSKQN